MANSEHLEILYQGVKVWNKWRNEKVGLIPDLSGADLNGIDLNGVDLDRADLNGVRLNESNLCNAYFCEATLNQAYLNGAMLRRANFSRANLAEAQLSRADLTEAKLYKAKLYGTNFSMSNLTRADLTGAYLMGASMIKTILTDAILTNCKIYGISVWDVTLENIKQDGLIITQEGQPEITVDNLEVAQFVYMLMAHKKIRTVINTMTGKGVLLLGRFGDGRKSILDGIADVLRKKDLLPIVFDFDPPRDRDVTETVMTLAGLCKYVIADLTMPKSIGHESRTIIPNLAVPFVPLIEGNENPYPMFPDLKKYNWVLDLVRYENQTHLMSILDKQVLAPAEQKYLYWQEKKKEFHQAMYKKV